MTSLTKIRDGWNHAAKQDAFFNILTDPKYRYQPWPRDDFFQTGAEEVAVVLNIMRDHDAMPEQMQLALDFGCGVGRLTQALASHFAAVLGVDVSGEMIKQAREHNRFGRAVQYRVNGSRLQPKIVPGFDFIYTCLVLQHMPGRMQRGYIEEFVQLLAPGGTAVFQLPDGPDYEHPDNWLSMYTQAPETVHEWVAAAGGRMVGVELMLTEDPFTSWRYYMRAAR